MSDIRYLIVHKDHPIDVNGVNSGAEMATLAMAYALARLGKKVVVCAELRTGEQKKNGVEFWDLGATYDVSGALARARDLGNYHLISSGRAQAVLESRNEPRCVSRTFIIHDPSAGAMGVRPDIITRIADRIICVSNAQRDLFLNNGAEPSKVTVVYNGADLEVFKPGDPSNRDYNRIIFVGALVQDKGITLLVNAFSQLKSKYPSLKLDVYGSSAMWGREELFDQKQIEAALPGIKFHGSVAQEIVAEAYRTAGACIIPSIWFDSFPLTAVEAQVCGCPVIGFNVGGINEAIKNGITGTVIDDISEDALVRTLDNHMKDSTKLRSMSEAALKSARGTFNWERAAKEVNAICEVAARGRVPKIDTEGSIGYITTWNQSCGLATYAKYMLSEFEKETFTVLAEETDQTTSKDEAFVTRCWKRGSGDFSKLKQAIARTNIKLLHLNVHQSFFPQPEFAGFLRELRKSGVKVTLVVHSSFTIDPALSTLISECDAVIAHTQETALELIANGAKPEAVKILPHGVHISSGLDREKVRTSLGIEKSTKLIVSFGFIQPHKGMEAVLEAVAHLSSRGVLAKGYIIGSVMEADPGSKQYLQDLKNLSQRLGVTDKITIVEGFAKEDEISKYLVASDVVIMNYKSQYYEASGACSIALGAGAVVATSTAPPFSTFSDAVWHMTSGYPPHLSVELLVTNSELRKTLVENARKYCLNNCWKVTVQKLSSIYSNLGFKLSKTKEESVVASQNEQSSQAGTIRVLMQNRPNAFTQRGGDTVVMERLSQQLTKLGVEVTVDVDGTKDPKNYDLVHLFNFATPDFTKALADRAAKAGVPFVVTTLNEDVQCFHEKSRALASVLVQYVREGQNGAWFREQKIKVAQITSSLKFDNRWTAENAAALFANGASEAALLRNQYPGAKNTQVVKFGCDIGENGDPELFINQYGVKDFILCVGRIESRKNQLMLLKALEDTEIPVVLAGGGFSYQPDYLDAVRKFKRKGKTLVLDRLSSAMLASAYKAAKVHVLPSWYELPGLVSLEAAHYGCNVVASKYGTAEDYFGAEAFYCDPMDEGSILNAVLAAYYSPARPSIKDCVKSLSWEASARETVEIYRQVAKKPAATGFSVAIQPTAPNLQFSPPPSYRNAMTTNPMMTTGAVTNTAATVTTTPTVTTVPTQVEVDSDGFEECLTKGEEAAKKKDFVLAQTLLSKAEGFGVKSTQLFRARGAVYLAQNNIADASRYMDKALGCDPNDTKSIIGKGMCEMSLKNAAAAYDYFIKALKIEPNQLTAIHQLVESSFMLNKFDDLESVLTAYLKNNPTNNEIRYCYAGCLYKLGKGKEARANLEQILTANPSFKGAMQLRDIIDDEAKAKAVTPTNGVSAPKLENATPTSHSINGGGMMNKPSSPLTSSVSVTVAPPAASSRKYEGPEYISIELEKLIESKRRKQWDDIKRSCEAISNNPMACRGQKERARSYIAESWIAANNLAEAERIYSEVLAANPDSPPALCGKGALAASRGEFTSAEECFARASKVDPTSDIALAGLGLCKAYSGDSSSAWDFFSRALKINPENGRAVLGIIEVGYPLRRFKEIEAVIKQYLDLHPADINFIYSLGGCYYAQGRTEEALDEMHKVLIFDPEHKLAIELKELIVRKKLEAANLSGTPMGA